ncbi:MAG: hypothetical protein F4Z15_02350 [Gammaproteobacteria bacterium]|nr:hypothetical protein [Gammaproteobacteria bacterium]MYD76536.1 hypothetical protein [Gammaproteobacteria bacterium]MYJ52022.1 hypothetical protein [Gammaproteobacteria bacterium]
MPVRSAPSPAGLRLLAPVLGALLGIGSTSALADEYAVLGMAGKTPEQISALLGPPGGCQDTYQGSACQYAEGAIEVTFIDGQADWFTFANPPVSFDIRALAHIGLRPIEPLVRMPSRMHWLYHHGLEQISVYGSGETVLFIHVRAFTPE